MTKETQEVMRIYEAVSDHDKELIRRTIRIYAEGTAEAKEIMNGINLDGLTPARFEETIQRAESTM